MQSIYPSVNLGEVIHQYKEYIDEPEPRTYTKLSVKLYGRGVALDEPVDGTFLKMRKHQIAKSGQVILSEIWGKKGAIGFVPPEGDGALCTSHFFLFDVVKEKIDPKYLNLVFKSNLLENQLDSGAKGTTGYAAVRPKHLLVCEIPLPPLEEQRRIVARIEALATKIEEAQELKKNAIRDVNTLIFSETDRVFRDLENCRWVSIGELGVNSSNPIQTGPFGSQLLRSEFIQKGVPVINVGNIQPEGIKLEKLDYVTPEKAEQLSRYSLMSNDLLFARTGATLGKVCILPEECNNWLMTGHVLRVRFDQYKCNPRFAFLALRGAKIIRDQIFNQVRGATRPGFNTTLLSQVSFPLPSLVDQQRFIDHLDNFQEKIRHINYFREKSLKELNDLFPAILAKAFKGEL